MTPSPDWREEFRAKFVEWRSDYKPYIVNYKENDTEKVEDIETFIESLITAAEQRVWDEAKSVILAKYEEKKVKPIPQMLPAACPSLSHYKERRQGALSGLLIAIDLLEAARSNSKKA